MKKTIDIGELERVVGRVPKRYPKGDPRNWRRVNWWRRASHALASILNPDGRRVPLDPDPEGERIRAKQGGRL